MKLKLFIAAVLAATMLVALTACGKTQSTTSSDKLNSAVQQTEQQSDLKPSENQDSSTRGAEASKNESAEDEAWKKVLEERLFEEYGVLPEYYEDLGNGIYQVYVEVGGEVVPFVTVDSATGEYHG